jgi:hypothetical protein
MAAGGEDMDYERALEILRRAVEGTESEPEFEILEIRLRENLRDQRIVGSTPERSSQRFETLPGLNRISRRVLGCSFNDLLFDRFVSAGLASLRITELLKRLEARPTPEAISPPVQPRLQVLPFDKLTWEQFELLCAALVASQAQVDLLDCHLYGRRGEDQKGIDIVATQRGRDRTETWVYQCKLYKNEYTTALLKEALAKITYPADYAVVLLGREAGTGLREEVKHRDNTFLWDAIDISRKLKNHPQLIQDFFGAEWRKAFNP